MLRRLAQRTLWWLGYFWDIDAEEKRQQSNIIRDIFGNPFRPPPPVPPAVLSWNNGTVRRLAEAIYEERAFNRWPILADALLDAGCDNAELIEHCRSPVPDALAGVLGG